MVDQERQAPPEDGEDTSDDASVQLEEAVLDDAGIDADLESVSRPEPGDGDLEGAPESEPSEADLEVTDSNEAAQAAADGEEAEAEDSGADAGQEDGLASEFAAEFPNANFDGPEANLEAPDEAPADAEAAGEEAEAGADEEGEALEAAALESAAEAAEAGETVAEGDEAAPAAAVSEEAEAPSPTPVGADPVAAAAAAVTPTVGRWRRREARPRPPRPSRYTTEAPEWIAPEFEHQAVEAPSPPLGRSPGRLPAVILAILMSGVFLLFVLIKPTPTWLLLFGAIMAALGTDGVLRSIRHRIFEREGGPDTVPHLFLPTLFALSIPLFIQQNLESYWVIPAALVAGVTFVLVVLAEVPAEEAEDDEFRGRARFVSVAATYFVGFALFSLTYTFKLQLHESFLVVALVSMLLAVELLREGEIDPLETLLLAGVVGVVVAEARWVLKYMPIDAYPAGLSLVLVFYFVTGMVHAYMTRHINTTVAAEYSIVTVLGLALVVAARATGIA